MSALVHIVLKSAKNSLKELLTKPGKLALYIFIVAAIGGMAALSFFTRPDAGDLAPIVWFTGIYFVFLAMFVFIAVAKGVTKGDVIFGMNDANLLFVSPISPRAIMLYGILRLTQVSFFAGFFILFQGGNFARFGIGFDGVLLILLGVMLSVVVLSVVSLIIYNQTNGNPRRKRMVMCAAPLPFLPLIIYFALRLLAGGNVFAALKLTIASPFLTFIPIVGWTAAGVTRLLIGHTFAGVSFLAANALLGGLLVVYALRTNPDYYEDVLVATETAFEKKQAAASGNLNAARDNGKAVKVVKTGISGLGASAIFGKHLRESFRQNRFGFLTMASVITILASTAFLVFAGDMVSVLQILMWIQIFLIGTGRGLREIYTHYIYMIPEPPFRKMIWCNMEQMIQALFESALIFGVGGLVCGAEVHIIIGCAVTYALFSFLLLGVNYVSMRFTGADLSAGLLLLFYYLAVAVIMAPGLIAALLIGFSVAGTAGAFIGLCVLSAWELAAGLGCFALSKGVLHNCDIPVVRPK